MFYELLFQLSSNADKNFGLVFNIEKRPFKTAYIQKGDYEKTLSSLHKFCQTFSLYCNYLTSTF